MRRRTALQNCALLLGYGFASSIAGSTFISCTSDGSHQLQPEFFTEDELNFVYAFADTLLPRSDTPGALDVDVVQTIDSVIENCFTDDQKREVRMGIQRLDQDCITLNNKSLHVCSKEERIGLFTQLEKNNVDTDRYLWGNVIVSRGEPPFYRKLKGLCLMAYFTSEKVGKEVLRYDPLPGGYEGCVSLSTSDRSWTL